MVSVTDLDGEVAAIAGRLLEADVADVVPLAGGRNNQLFRIETRDASFALKRYPRDAADPRDRLGVEFEALRFLTDHGIAAVPRPVTRDEGSIAIYQWIDGAPIAAPTETDLEAALDLMAAMHRLRFRAETAWTRNASAAVFAPAQAVTQLQDRRARLDPVAARHEELHQFLAEFDAAASRLVGAARSHADAAELSWEAPLPRRLQTLSPSDMGFHNALRRTDGTVVFLDFEYFGWDDPAKLANDFADHPGSALAPAMAARFRRDAAAIYGASDAGYRDRAEVLRLLCGLIWCMILLNEFLPERWQRRNLAGRAGDPAAAGRRQLAKARALLQRLCTDERGMA